MFDKWEFSLRLQDLIYESHYQSRNQLIKAFNEYEPKDIQLDGSRISRYLNGAITPQADTIAKLADFFDVSCDYLIGNADHKTKDFNAQQIERMTGINADSINHLIELKDKFKEWTIHYNDVLAFLIDNYYYDVINDNPESLPEDTFHVSDECIELISDFYYMQGDSLLSSLYNAMDLTFASEGKDFSKESIRDTDKFLVHHYDLSDVDADYPLSSKHSGVTISLTMDQLQNLMFDSLKEMIKKKYPEFNNYNHSLPFKAFKRRVHNKKTE